MKSLEVGNRPGDMVANLGVMMANQVTPEAAVARWAENQPYGGATEREKNAFLAGFDAANKPLAMNKERAFSFVTEKLNKAEKEKADRAALLPAGTCLECEGEGEQGGQFSGYWKCEACNGTGKTNT